jgi:hypothetical protein
VLPPNLWWANHPGSTLFMPVGDASEVTLGLLALMVRHGVMLVDQDTGEPAGDLEPFVRSGLLDPEKRLPLAELLADVHECVCMELAMMAHNIVLMMQAIGLGGLFFNGLDSLSVLGARAGDGPAGSASARGGPTLDRPQRGGARRRVRGALPTLPAGHARGGGDVRRAEVRPGGAYDPGTAGRGATRREVKRTVEPYSGEFVDCMSEVARYIHDRFGRLPRHPQHHHAPRLRAGTAPRHRLLRRALSRREPTCSRTRSTWSVAAVSTGPKGEPLELCVRSASPGVPGRKRARTLLAERYRGLFRGEGSGNESEGIG